MVRLIVDWILILYYEKLYMSRKIAYRENPPE